MRLLRCVMRYFITVLRDSIVLKVTTGSGVWNQGMICLSELEWLLAREVSEIPDLSSEYLRLSGPSVL